MRKKNFSKGLLLIGVIAIIFLYNTKNPDLQFLRRPVVRTADRAFYFGKNLADSAISKSSGFRGGSHYSPSTPSMPVLLELPDIPPGELRYNIIQTANKYNASKTRYKYGAIRPSGDPDGTSYFDCSGFAFHVYKECGITLPRTSKEMSIKGVPIEKGELSPGDIILFDTSRWPRGNVNHVAIYAGNNQMIHSTAMKPNPGVVVTPFDDKYFTSKIIGYRTFLRKGDSAAPMAALKE